jgi:hypothetical protein
MASPHPPEPSARDLRSPWALEEAGIAYAVRKLDAPAERPADYYREQPFGQVPSYRDDTVSLFESGAIVLHIGRDCETLLPVDPAARARDGVERGIPVYRLQAGSLKFLFGYSGRRKKIWCGRVG